TYVLLFFFSSRRRHTRFKCDWSSDVCSSDLSWFFSSRSERKSRRLLSGPVWSPNSRCLLFLSDREEKNQLWLIDTDGGEARKLTNMLHGVSEAAWSLDGQWIAFTAMAALQDDDELLMGRKTLNADEKKKYEEEE